jgi:NADH:ubiquinone oxidoreductase subunit H
MFTIPELTPNGIILILIVVLIIGCIIAVIVKHFLKRKSSALNQTESTPTDVSESTAEPDVTFSQ